MALVGQKLVGQNQFPLHTYLKVWNVQREVHDVSDVINRWTQKELIPTSEGVHGGEHMLACCVQKLLENLHAGARVRCMFLRPYCHCLPAVSACCAAS